MKLLINIPRVQYYLLNLFIIVGYVIYIPYFVSNIIYLILPLFLIYNIFTFRVKVTSNLFLFFTLWVLIEILPFIFHTNIFELKTNILVIFLNIIAPILIYVIIVNLNITRESFSKMLITLFIINLIILIIQYLFFDHVRLRFIENTPQWIKWGEQNPFLVRRAAGLLGNINSSAAFSLVVYVLLKDYFADNRVKSNILLLFTVLIIFFLTKSRITMLTMLLLPIFYSFMKGKYKIIIVYASILLVFLFFLYLFKDSELINSILRTKRLFGNEQNSLSTRIIVNSQAWHIWERNFILLGGGIKTESFYMIKFEALRPFSEMLYTKMLLEKGIAGLLMYFLFFYYIVKNKLKDKVLKHIVISFLFIIVFISFGESVFYVKELYFFTFSILGSLVSIQKSNL